ncbi:MAG: ABC transporter permease [Proteobacteria bacterium]|nr:ABC transporter permease [Pseudomonadota bacterium]MDA1299161.1 ABC transporter permease [Pseudomonadota bacterium]
MLKLSPLNLRRLANFKANRRGFLSLKIIGVLFILSLCAEFIANDSPLLLRYDGAFYFPVFVTYPESTFGSEFGTEAEYLEPEVQALIEAGGGWALWPPIPFSYDTIDLATEGTVPEAPSARHWLGTDDIGRDVLARLIYGFRLSMLFGLALTLFSSLVGIAVGATQGYFGGLVDLIGQRLVEVWSGLPVLFLLIIVSSLVQPSPLVLLPLLIAFGWTALVPVVRAEFLRTRNFDHVRAARALGQTDLVIMARHVLPNAMVATLTFLPFVLNGSIITLTTLDFLGFGLPLGSPSLGELLAQGKANIQAPWLGLSAFFTLAIMLTLLIFVGEGIRDALDPRRSAT